MTERVMPLQLPWRRAERDLWAGVPRSVPWSVVKGHEQQAWQNHGQSLERLAERCGLSPDELWAVVHDQRWRPNPIPVVDMIEWIRSLQVEQP